jgi:clan AA aspartic protease
MMRGEVDVLRRPVLSVRLYGLFGSQTVEALIDTGYNGALALPSHLVQRLGLPDFGNRLVQYADGRVAVEQTHVAELEWLGGRRRCRADATQLAECLIGTELLEGHALTIDFGTAKSVEVR